jgi:D-sedoheptulose 7-phosphate isomerase
MRWADYAEAIWALLRQVDEGQERALTEAIEEAYRSERLVFIVGNGGSGANASHLCEDLGKGTLSDLSAQRRLRVISLTDNTPYILAWGNDAGFERVFVEQLRNLAQRGDLLIAISGSGNSPNVLRAVEHANATGMRTFGLTGYDGGKLMQLAHGHLHVPSHDMGMVEAVHGVLLHHLVDVLRERFKADRGLADG